LAQAAQEQQVLGQMVPIPRLALLPLTVVGVVEAVALVRDAQAAPAVAVVKILEQRLEALEIHHLQIHHKETMVVGLME
jgi:hypothetical protein